MENNLNNLPPFYVGQKVVYITGINMPKDSVHIVRDIKFQACGCWIVKLDGYVRELCSIGKMYNCGICGKNYLNMVSWGGISSKSLRPLQESIFPSLTMSRVIEKEKELISMN